MNKEALEFHMERMGEAIKNLGEVLRKAEEGMRMSALEFMEKWGSKLPQEEWIRMFDDLLKVRWDASREAEKSSEAAAPTQTRTDRCPKCNERTEGRPHFCPCPR